MLAGRRYRLELTTEQALFAERIGGICRAVWNTALEQRRAYRRRGASIGYAEQCRQLAAAKTDFPWLAEAPSHCLQQTLNDLDRAVAAHGVGRVRWKSRQKTRPSFRFPEGKRLTVEKINRKWGRVRLPKFGWVRFRRSRPLGGQVRSATLTRDGRHWFISFLVEDGHPTPQMHDGPAVGVDRGVVSAAVTSDGEFYDRRNVTSADVSSFHPPAEDRKERAAERGYLSAGEAKRHLRLQRRLARSRPGGSGRRRVVVKLAGVMRRVRRRRADFNAQAAHRLTARYGLIVLED
ncbi:RNA-guided endonuclease InsQ/TnpB family protein, partial [Streptosporangium sp. NPDC087985]|uniref:RNA-guided endonuclease InsQ/TnpB family protein n=1 Tax=Streptosporangium sp. NPDC087985 TaxID=3366196 RepID=UPI003808FA45